MNTHKNAMPTPQQGAAPNARDDERVRAILAHLDRAGVPESRYPDAQGEYWAHCPFHEDSKPTNFSFSAQQGAYKCFACGAQGHTGQLASALGVAEAPRTAGVSPAPAPTPRRDLVMHGCTVSGGVTEYISLAGYAAAKHLDPDELRHWGVSDYTRQGKAMLRIPYLDESGRPQGTRYRLAMAGEQRFRWAVGSKLIPYGLNMLDKARERGFVALVEGESDAHTLWHHHIPALGIPGANTFQAKWAKYVEGLKVYAWQEPDQGGRTFIGVLSKHIPGLRVLVAPEGRKDVSECHVLGDDVSDLMRRLMEAARTQEELEEEKQAVEAIALAKEAWESCKDLAHEPDILVPLARTLNALGLVGEDSIARVLYLALTSRLLDKPVSVVVKGPSGGGKSFAVERVLCAMPQEAYHDLTGMSEHALIYDDEPISHRTLVIYEAHGTAGETADYILRTLLSEGCIRYVTVIKGEEGLQPLHIDRPGPTNVILTTTWPSLHPENETRLLTLTVQDTPSQTAGILEKLGERANGKESAEPDLGPWHALQTWLALDGVRQVAIPYAPMLGQMTAPVAVRLRRDFTMLLSLVAAHAMLHQATRQRDPLGRVVATLEDYRAVHALVGQAIDQGVQAGVSRETRETAEAVSYIWTTQQHPAMATQVAQRLGLDKSSTTRRLKVACELPKRIYSAPGASFDELLLQIEEGAFDFALGAGACRLASARLYAVVATELQEMHVPSKVQRTGIHHEAACIVHQQLFGSATEVTQALLQSLKDRALGFIQTGPVKLASAEAHRQTEEDDPGQLTTQ